MEKTCYFLMTCGIYLQTLGFFHGISAHSFQTEDHPHISENDLIGINNLDETPTDYPSKVNFNSMSDRTPFSRLSPIRRYARRRKSSLESREQHKRALRLLRITRSLKESGITNEVLQESSARFTVIDDVCIPVPPCKPSKYRTIDGSCNNLHQPLLGKSFTTLRRFGPTDYSDGIELPRVARDGTELPSSRLVAASVFPDADMPDSKVTLAVMQFGQFIDHDFGLTPIFLSSDGSELHCCTESGDFLSEDLRHPACFPIDIPEDDIFYNMFSQKCMSFTRSMAGARNNCTLGYADQLNEPTHWLDGSQIYGNTAHKELLLRKFEGGRLKMSSDDYGRELLPIHPIPCNSTEGSPCFIAGDIRVEEMPLLTVMHTVWFREHNRIADELAALNPTWSDEIVYQEARRIVIAELQHIIYTEWLPAILSPHTLKANGLIFADSETFLFNMLGSTLGNMVAGLVSNLGNIFGLSFTEAYDPSIDAAVSNEISTAAFRMGHSLLQGVVRMYDEDDREVDSYKLSSVFFNPSMVKTDREFYDRAIRGMLKQPSQSIDSKITSEVTEQLFRNVSHDAAFGMSLPALNIQRGRDHGLPGYNTYRKVCGLSKVREFTELNNIPGQIVAKLMQLYKSVDDIDLFVGGMVENSVRGGLLGPVFSCILADQFSKWRHGDRFFYETRGQPHSFSLGQLTEIRKSSLAKILCDNNDGSIKKVQPRVFLMATGTNAKVSCDEIPQVDLTLWRNEPV